MNSNSSFGDDIDNFYGSITPHNYISDFDFKNPLHIPPNYSYTNLNTTVDFSKTTSADMIVGGKSMLEFMNKVEDRLLILQPDPAKLKKYEALRNAYEQYKLVEALLHDD